MENFQITKLVSRKFKGGAVSYRHLNVEIPEYEKKYKYYSSTFVFWIEATFGTFIKMER
jgi:hypothetical protein